MFALARFPPSRFGIKIILALQSVSLFFLWLYPSRFYLGVGLDEIVHSVPFLELGAVSYIHEHHVPSVLQS